MTPSSSVMDPPLASICSALLSHGCPGLECGPRFPSVLGSPSKPPGGPTIPSSSSVASPSPTWVTPPSGSWKHQWPSTPPQMRPGNTLSPSCRPCCRGLMAPPSHASRSSNFSSSASALVWPGTSPSQTCLSPGCRTHCSQSPPGIWKDGVACPVQLTTTTCSSQSPTVDLNYHTSSLFTRRSLLLKLGLTCTPFHTMPTSTSERSCPHACASFVVSTNFLPTSSTPSCQKALDMRSYTARHDDVLAVTFEFCKGHLPSQMQITADLPGCTTSPRTLPSPTSAQTLSSGAPRLSTWWSWLCHSRPASLTLPRGRSSSMRP